MAKATTAPKKTPAKAKKPAKGRPGAEKAKAEATAADTAEAAAKKAKPRKAAAPKTAKDPVDTRIVEMRGETRLIHHGGGADALAALHPTIDTVNAGGRVLITGAAHAGGSEVNVHVVPIGHTKPYEDNPGVVLTIGANGLMAFDGVHVGLATTAAIEETVLAVMDAVKPVEGEAATPAGRRADWYPQAVSAVEEVASRLATA